VHRLLAGWRCRHVERNCMTVVSQVIGRSITSLPIAPAGHVYCAP
jgi:hypothetical protein